MVNFLIWENLSKRIVYKLGYTALEDNPSANKYYNVIITQSIKQLWMWDYLLIKQSSINMVMVFNTTFNNISVISCMAISFIGGGNQRKPPTCRKSLQTLSHNVYQVHLAWAGFKLTSLVVIALIAQIVINPTTIRSRPWRPLN